MRENLFGATAADPLLSARIEAKVKRMYGVVGDSLNGVIDSLLRDESIQWMHTRPEESA